MGTGVVLTHVRRIRLLLTICFALALASPIAHNPAGAAAEPAPLDLAAMVVLPDDLADLGFPGFKIKSGHAQSIDEIAETLSSESGVSAEDTRSLLTQLDFRRGYALTLALPKNAEGRTVVVTAYELGTSGQSITQGFKTLWKSAADETVPGALTFGDESSVIRTPTSSAPSSASVPSSPPSASPAQHPFHNR